MAAAVASRLTLSDAQFHTVIGHLKNYVPIQTVSNLGEKPSQETIEANKKTMLAGAEFAKGLLEDAGFEPELITVDNSNPYVVATRVQDVSLPTIMFYAHYDVQPVDPSEWDSDPFIVEERDGRLYGRGVSDDKAGVITIITALGTYLKEHGALPFNVVVVFEGEEEIGSPNFAKFVEVHQEKLNADVLIVMDGINQSSTNASLTPSTRGIVSYDVRVDAQTKSVHSGVGFNLPDPERQLSRIKASLDDLEANPQFGKCSDLSDEERIALRKDSQSYEAYARASGLVEGAKLRGDPAISIAEHAMTLPTLTVLNAACGKPRGGNSIQSHASAQISCRVLPGQDPHEIGEMIKTHIEGVRNPQNLKVTVALSEEPSWAWKGDVSMPHSQMYLDSLREEFPKASADPCGGALPLLKILQTIFPKMEMVVPAVEDDKTDAHSANESQDLGVLRNAINSMFRYFDKLAAKVAR